MKAFALSFLLFIQPAPILSAEQGCIPLSNVLKILRSEHGEEVLFTGIEAFGSHITLVHNGKTGSWSLVGTKNNCSFMIMSGIAGKTKAPGKSI